MVILTGHPEREQAGNVLCMRMGLSFMIVILLDQSLHEGSKLRLIVRRLLSVSRKSHGVENGLLKTIFA